MSDSTLTLKEAAERLGVSVSTLRRWRRADGQRGRGVPLDWVETLASDPDALARVQRGVSSDGDGEGAIPDDWQPLADFARALDIHIKTASRYVQVLTELKARQGQRLGDKVRKWYVHPGLAESLLQQPERLREIAQRAEQAQRDDLVRETLLQVLEAHELLADDLRGRLAMVRRRAEGLAGFEEFLPEEKRAAFREQVAQVQQEAAELEARIEPLEVSVREVKEQVERGAGAEVTISEPLRHAWTRLLQSGDFPPRTEGLVKLLLGPNDEGAPMIAQGVAAIPGMPEVKTVTRRSGAGLSVTVLDPSDPGECALLLRHHSRIGTAPDPEVTRGLAAFAKSEPEAFLGFAKTLDDLGLARSLAPDRHLWSPLWVEETLPKGLVKGWWSLLDRAASGISGRLGPRFELVHTGQVYECGGQSHRLPTFRHKATGIALNLIPGGTFRIGSEEGPAVERPTRLVPISPLLVGVTSVTQKQWDRIGGEDERKWFGADLPIERVSWNDASLWLRKAGAGLRLLSESEWEYACRAGTQSKWCFGDDESDLTEFGWYRDNSAGKTHEVGRKRPNAFGLKDMHGNVWDWCEDHWIPTYESGPTDNMPRVVGESLTRSARGGSWDYSDLGSLSSSRGRLEVGDRYADQGFRVALDFD